jgi:hypothetical protein
MNPWLVSIISFTVSLLPPQISNQDFSDKVSLEFFSDSDFQVKIDGGCSFYTYDTTSLSKESYVLVIDSRKLAFSKIKGKLVYFTHVKRALVSGGYVDTFSEADHKMILDVKMIGRTANKEPIFSGLIKITHHNSLTTIPVHGVNNEHVFSVK